MTYEEEHKLLLAALQDGRFQHFSLVVKSDKKRGFCGDGDSTPQLVQLMQLHQEHLIKLLKKNMVALYWNDGDTHAEAMLIPVKPRPNEKFEEFKLEFPPPTPTLVN